MLLPSGRSHIVKNDGLRAGLTLVATSLGFWVVQLDVSVVNVATKSIGADFGGGVSAVQWVISGYTITFAAFILSAGALADRIGAKRVFVSGFLLFAAASIACGVAPTVQLLVGARIVQGVGAAILVPCSLALISHAYPVASERARAIGVLAVGGSAALSIGPLIGGGLIQAFGWRAIFYINFPISIVAIALSIGFTAETTRTATKRRDVLGQLSAIGALALLVWAVIDGGRLGFVTPTVLATLAVGALLAAAFVMIERKSANPMLPPGLFRSSQFSIPISIGFVTNVSFYGLIFVFSLYFQRVDGYSAIATGLAFLPMTGAAMVANALVSRLASRIGAGRVMAIGSVSMAFGTSALLGISANENYAALVGQLIALGFGLGLIVPAMTATVLSSVEPPLSGIASGTLSAARQAGSAIGVALFGSFIALNIKGPGISIALVVATALAVCAGVLAVILPRITNTESGEKK